jgi:hypothetical protein
MRRDSKWAPLADGPSRPCEGIVWKPGTEVVLYRPEYKESRYPRPAEMLPGRVVKAGRRWATVSYLWRGSVECDGSFDRSSTGRSLR